MLNLFFGFNGRINRAQYWLGMLFAGIVGIALVAALLMSVGASVTSATPNAGAVIGALLMIVPVLALLSWCGYALQVKRFHDRGRTGWLVVIPVALSFASMASLMGALASGTPLPVATLQPNIFGILNMIVGLWFFIDLGCLPGVAGPNRFGNPPGSSGGAPTPLRPDTPTRPAKPTLGVAEAAMERAIAERARTAQQPKPAPAAPAPALAMAAAPRSFGRRAAR